MRIKYCLGLHTELAKSKKREKVKKEVLYKHKIEAGSKFPNIQDKTRWQNFLQAAPFLYVKHSGKYSSLAEVRN